MASLMSAYGRLPVTMQRGAGTRVWDVNGQEYFDALTGIAVCSLGHSNPAIAAAVADQATTLLHCSNLYNIPQQEALGAKLCKLAAMDKVFFCNSGAEANEANIKIARLWGHKKGIENPTILVTDTAFHGRTLATIAATGNEKIQAGFGPLTPGFEVVPYDDIAAIEAMAAARNDIVAVLVEPVQGEGGIQVPSDSYLPNLRKMCDQHDWLLLLDEVQAGMGRTGRWFGHQHTDIKPDVMAIAKALGNGLPIGACLARGAAAEVIQPGSHGTTFGGNPLCCRVGLTVIDEIEKHGLVERAAVLGEQLQQGFSQHLHNCPDVKDIRGKGLMIGIELTMPCAELVKRAIDKGVLLNVTAGNVIRLLPPLIMSDAEGDELVERVSELIIDFLAEQATDDVAVIENSTSCNDTTEATNV